MRVISGKYKGKNIEGFNIMGTRPTMDRVKESLFAIIQEKLVNSNCLDLFAGSGSLGIEAISNGAKSCTFIDNHNHIFAILKRNLQGIGGANLKKCDYLSFLKTTDETFDIIFLDPPYKLYYIQSCIDEIEKRDLLNKDGIIVCEYEDEVFTSNYQVIKEKRYGSKNIRILKN